jgi:peptide/nickel transport system substrate-binding protein
VRRLTRTGPLAVILLAATALAACSSGASTSAKSGSKTTGGTAVFALAAGNVPSWIFPLTPAEFATTPNIEFFQFQLYRPLFWFGGPGAAGLNESQSIAEPATFATSGGKTTATITLKRYAWSDGKPVTSRDVQFWFNLLRAEKANWWDYSPGTFPDNVVSFTINSPYKFSIEFNGAYSGAWLYDELAQLIPLPQHAWDRTSAAGPVGNYDQTSAGAAAVYTFLAAQSKDLATYATNPLWKIVDGPWHLASFTASNGATAMVRNPSFSGPSVKDGISELKLVPFTSDAAEFNALLSGDSSITVGYVPFNDIAALSRVTSAGYKVVPWKDWAFNYIPLNFAQPTIGPVFAQLYVREAMQHLINETAITKSVFQGFGVEGYGPVPGQPSSTYLSPQQSTDPYPYDPGAARTLLTDHGWTVRPHGTSTCSKPGTAADECGPGVPAGAKLAFSLDYSAGQIQVNEEASVLQSAFSSAGIALSLKAQPMATVSGQWLPCPKPSCWQALFWGNGWGFYPMFAEPVGDEIFATNAPANGGAYSNAEADSLINAVHTGSLSAFYSYENYISKQVPVLWMATPDYFVTAIKANLAGASPTDPLMNLYPQDWYFVRG